jgi:hypothetical protein
MLLEKCVLPTNDQTYMARRDLAQNDIIAGVPPYVNDRFHFQNTLHVRLDR